MFSNTISLLWFPSTLLLLAPPYHRSDPNPYHLYFSFENKLASKRQQNIIRLKKSQHNEKKTNKQKKRAQVKSQEISILFTLLGFEVLIRFFSLFMFSQISVKDLLISIIFINPTLRFLSCVSDVLQFPSVLQQVCWVLEEKHFPDCYCVLILVTMHLALVRC